MQKVFTVWCPSAICCTNLCKVLYKTDHQSRLLGFQEYHYRIRQYSLLFSPKICHRTASRRSSNIQDSPSLERRAACELYVQPLIEHHSRSVAPEMTSDSIKPTGVLFWVFFYYHTRISARERKKCLDIGYLRCQERVLMAWFHSGQRIREEEKWWDDQ